MIKRPSANFDDRLLAIDMLVLHYTGLPSLEQSLAWMCDPAKKVSAHYCVAEDGEVCQLVDEKNRAWHAGKSYWAGVTDINSCSIGIEIQNPGHEFGYTDFPDKQIAAVIKLSKDIIERYKIPKGRILAHSDIAPDRKQDPGEKFPWERLASEGVGLWPEERKFLTSNTEEMSEKLFTRFGYSPDAEFEKVVLAFQRHWYPENVTGAADQETVRRFLALL